MRNLKEVIDQMLAVIPESYTKLRASLQLAKRRLVYAAPETLTLQWDQVGDLVNLRVPPLVEDWRRQVISIWTTTPVSELPHNENSDGVDKSLDDLDMSIQLRNAYRRNNIKTLRELASHTENELRGWKNFGAVALHDTKRLLDAFGWSLRTDGTEKQTKQSRQ